MATARSDRFNAIPFFSKNPASTSERSSALLPQKNDDSCTRSYAGRGSSPRTVTEQGASAGSDSRNRWPTMPLPITRSVERAFIAGLAAKKNAARIGYALERALEDGGVAWKRTHYWALSEIWFAT